MKIAGCTFQKRNIRNSSDSLFCGVYGGKEFFISLHGTYRPRPTPIFLIEITNLKTKSEDVWVVATQCATIEIAIARALVMAGFIKK